VLPHLRLTQEQIPAHVRDQYAASVVAPFGCGSLDNALPWAAVRQVITEPEDGDEPDGRLITAIAAAAALADGWTEADTTELAAQMRDRCTDSEHPEFWQALAEEVAAAGGVPGPPAQ